MRRNPAVSLRAIRESYPQRQERVKLFAMIDIGSQIENALYRSRGNRNAAGEWSRISSDLRVLSDAYGLGNYNGSRNRNTDWRNRVPFPLPF